MKVSLIQRLKQFEVTKVNTCLKLILGVIVVSCSLGLFSDDNKPMDGLIRIGDLLWDVKNNRSGFEWDAATKYCAEKGMRLPSKEELITHQDELLKLEEDREVLRKDRDKNNPHHTILYLYWSSTEYEKDSSMVWTIVLIPLYVPSNRSTPVRKSYRHSNVRCLKNAERI